MSGRRLVARFEARRGELALTVELQAPVGVTVLFGPSAAGKSTTLHLVAGLLQPSAGRIALGDDVWYDGARAIARPPEARRVAYVFQSLALFPHLSVAGNVEFGADRGLDRATRRAAAEAALARLGIAHLAARRPATLSGGEAQRVALARAVAMRPALLLLDEPFTALDAPLRRRLGDELRALVAELEVPALLVTHDAAEARGVGDHLVPLEAGRTGPSQPIVAARDRVES